VPAVRRCSHDPQPSLLLDAQARPLELNAALRALLEQLSLAECEACCRSIACRWSRRAWGSAGDRNVEAQCADRILVWTFIPDPGENRVLARCRDASAQIAAERESAKAGGCTG
jgi:hypothetical protein